MSIPIPSYPFAYGTFQPRTIGQPPYAPITMARPNPLPPNPLPMFPVLPPSQDVFQSQSPPPSRLLGLPCKPQLVETQQDRLNALTLNPSLYQRFAQLQIPEGPVLGVKMFTQISKNMGPTSQQHLHTLLQQGVLTQQKADDGHSALYQLYGILTTPRAPGYDNRAILQETLQVLAKPYSISQRFAPTTPQAAQALLGAHHSSALYGGTLSPAINPQDLHVENSATCVASSVMYYMADKEPADLARHINELTSPLNAFFEKARFEEISPDNPADALNLLNSHQISYSLSGPGEVLVKVENPPTGVVRAITSQGNPGSKNYRNAIGAAYQSALTYLATHSYNPATDLRDSDVPGETSKGLTEAEKTLMEAIVKDNGSFQSVTYQAVGSKANPAPGEENNSYLFGYNRPFEKTIQDILQALQMNEPVIIGTTDTDETGAIVAGHEITITGAYTDPKDSQLKFVVADSDDDVAGPVIKNARELIPTIHHAGLPVALARQINREIQTNAGYLVPDQRDQMNFKLLARETGPMPLEPTETPPVSAPINPFQPIQPAPFPAQAFNPNYPNPFQQIQGTLPGLRVAPAA
ncbi:hypothetical protein [Vampirovibrio chlorellavorus]|uniref:hypothetical protein n=1 Tax=Vampirovibrio chlorellavorus TaxID=758823 RepID=UPI0026ECA90C|nr:hypothetical protein [Vampirovibrio chlorellavorus]